MTSTPRPQHTPAPVACLNCRDKHVKCDGDPAGCSRCTASNVPCHYLPSRRGRRCPPKSQSLIDCPDLISSPTMMDLSSQPGPVSQGLSTCNTQVNSDDYSFFESPNIGIDAAVYLPPQSEYCSVTGLDRILNADSTAFLSCQQQTYPPSDSGEAHLIKMFYYHFYPAHPFLLPHKDFLKSGPPRYLVDLMQLISLHYISPNLVTGDRITQIQTAVQEASLSVEKAQALLLLCIAFHAHVAPQAAKACLNQAVNYSLQLGLHCRDASDSVMALDPVRAESLRRTWWEIFVVDTLLAAVQVDGTLQFTSEETPDVPLPCELEQDTHNRGHDTCPSITGRDLDQSRHLLLFEESDLSSLGYRVEASIILRKCLLAASQEPIHALDATISRWFHRLPSNKRVILQCNGELDQMTFQAVMLMHCASIYLHFPRSRLLAFLPVTRHIFCSVPPEVISCSAVPQLHTNKVISAAVDLSNIASLSTSVLKQSPFFCCVLVLSSIIQLACHSARLEGLHSTDLHFLGLNLGMLKSLGELWAIAAVSESRLRDVVKEVSGVIGIQS
ncbi:hypothetical protein FOPG_17766 [Fusarium oxysporum f. sp. conglutinans race 2 54008]|uniref:Zn(2)-C6 fungal-type domain-containing protein n=2 Tax=Fusarium oxysporum f. sp. conglutinans TaxID=100902 RepID=F9F5L6_FUSOF|nr:hypothetical protein FOXB_01691 [Fusarium oxysporum f. sp. conglutinans Fo5176]EXL66039.1 hypothetical protein FOPG_17766 [Fusarium oxysporum f. sp. conglutinans race 2 54008]KAG7001864.1 hypothetical protein FocnCong_v011239 [Fusarium oxysporum f. sp. conglutinans]KAI8396577.1 hypothetical protein FOFC_21125 [Fusarium oxysporum]